MKLFSKTVLVSLLSLSLFNINPQIVKADFKNLTACKDSTTFKKRLTTSVKKLENRLKLYTPESKEALFLQKELTSGDLLASDDEVTRSPR